MPWAITGAGSHAGLGKETPTRAHLIVSCTRGAEDPERATPAFFVGNAAAPADEDVVIC
jgi:hypothetical protein